MRVDHEFSCGKGEQETPCLNLSHSSASSIGEGLRLSSSYESTTLYLLVFTIYCICEGLCWAQNIRSHDASTDLRCLKTKGNSGRGGGGVEEGMGDKL